jgi:exopolyphosphatase / guanosine-5'-triphosphate,3'-diphosphate pyrophosphatase
MWRMPRYAAIDIGSNSIRMEAAEVIPGQPARVLASDREVTRLGEGVFRGGAIDEDAARATCAVLRRMADLYRSLDVVGVRAVATSAVRDARNQRSFLERASEAAGTPVELVSGREEARLIHVGVASAWPQPGKRVLVIDIGGGSAEIIAAHNDAMEEAFSRPLGAVRLTEMFLRHDPPQPVELHRMAEYIEEKAAMAVRRLGNRKWDRAIATSATASTMASAVARLGRGKREDFDRVRVTAAQARQLYARLSALDLQGRRKVAGIGPRRAEIVVPGVAVLAYLLRAFRLPAFYYSRAGVRDGIIADLAARGVGSERSRLTREQRREVERMSRRYGVAVEHARHVAGVACLLFDGLQPLHELPPACGRLLEAAAHLHDVGHYVSDTAHHKHSHYLVANSDMPGFTERERLLIAGLCRYHRKAMPSPVHPAYLALTPEERRQLALLVPLLRLADNLDRSHTQRIQDVRCRIVDGKVLLDVVSKGDVDLEQWAAERAAEAFQQVYNRPVALSRSRAGAA